MYSALRLQPQVRKFASPFFPSVVAVVEPEPEPLNTLASVSNGVFTFTNSMASADYVAAVKVKDIARSQREAVQSPIRNLVGMCLAERLTGETPMSPPYLSRRNAEFYDLFVMNLRTRFSGDDYGTKLWAYLSALAGLENGALFKDLLGAECVAYLLLRAEFCSALDQIQLYLLLCFVQDSPSPLVRVSLPPVPMNAYRKALSKYCLAHETLQLVGNHPSAKLCAAVLGQHPSCNSTQLCMLLAEPGFRFPAGSLPSGDEYPLWTDALRFMLANGKGLHVGPRAHMLLAL
ncbi:hypothetical protein T492DRAFT_896939, partial [Pavlovales sp. CCMP2436]